MFAAGYACLCLLCGCLIVRWLLPRRLTVERVWLGLSLGLFLMMWMPALAAFAAGRFSMQAHWIALAPLAAVTACAFFMRDRRPVSRWKDEDTRLMMQAALVVLPLTVLSAWLQYTHVMCVAADGSWHVGQSTYGDLPMHLSFITGLKNAAFPPDYPIYAGHAIGYPFLTDTLSTTFYLMGWSLQSATVIPAVLMMALCFFGVLVLGRRMTAGRKTVVLAALLFFLNGGLGFLYDFDQAGGREADGTLTIVDRVQSILYGYYKTPTNQPEPNNLRWSNVIADMMVPQRTLLGGWCMVFPCFYLLYTAFDPAQREKGNNTRGDLLLAVWAGGLPLIHTHSFLALGLCSAGMLVWDVLHDPERKVLLRRYLRYGIVAVALAAPQLLLFTFRQVENKSGNGRFLQLWFNWVNSEDGTLRLRDLYLWFYVKNIGLPFLALLAALFEKNARHRRLFAGALPIILLAETVRFQPNVYDNNKLLYLAWLLCSMIAADAFAALWRRLKGVRARPVIAAFTAAVLFLSAGLTLWREAVSDYQAFSAQAVEAGEFARDGTPEGAVFLTGTQHLNPVASIGGRTIVCGPDLWLYYHGFDTAEAKNDIRRFLEDPQGSLDVIAKYDVSYVYVSSYERSDYDADTDTLDAMYERVFENSEAVIWKIPEG